VTIENQGAYPAEDYELVLIPHYGWGPPNPAGYVALPDLTPLVPHTEVFSPGVLYSTAGTYTLRVLVTDDWYALGDPDSTGTNGDYQDFTITVTEAYSMCNPFEGMEYSFVILPIQEDIMMLPVYMKLVDAVVPGLVPPNELEPVEYYAKLGDIGSNTCGLQGGYDNRLYCTFTLPLDVPGSVLNYYVFKKGCDDAVATQLNMVIPELSVPACSEDLSPEECVAAGGEYIDSVTRAPYCACP
jgi:hypothetical protein